jgi:hypothetical protein
MSLTTSNVTAISSIAVFKSATLWNATGWAGGAFNPNTAPTWLAANTSITPSTINLTLSKFKFELPA